VKYLLKISYDGAQFAGFQRQPDVRTVQGELEDHLGHALGEEIRLSCAGRTDKGVHGWGQVVLFKTSNEEPILPILEATNLWLAPSIQVRQVVEPPRGFRPRFSAKSRTYSYYMRGNTPSGSRVTEGTWSVARELDLERMKKAAEVFVGEHDFTSFSYRCGTSGNVRRLHSLTIERLGLPFSRKKIFRIRITGSGFLRKMVRLLVAGVVECGIGSCAVEDLARRLERRDPALAPHPAPAHGLYLESVQYDPDPFKSSQAREVPFEGMRVRTRMLVS
jgi:tRNA pseudouridine38-40 synthase